MAEDDARRPPAGRSSRTRSRTSTRTTSTSRPCRRCSRVRASSRRRGPGRSPAGRASLQAVNRMAPIGHLMRSSITQNVGRAQRLIWVLFEFCHRAIDCAPPPPTLRPSTRPTSCTAAWRSPPGLRGQGVTGVINPLGGLARRAPGFAIQSLRGGSCVHSVWTPFTLGPRGSQVISCCVNTVGCTGQKAVPMSITLEGLDVLNLLPGTASGTHRTRHTHRLTHLHTHRPKHVHRPRTRTALHTYTGTRAVLQPDIRHHGLA
jgi:hypothetical protein